MEREYELFEKTEKYRQLELKAWPLFATAQKGTTITHEQLEQSTGLDRHSPEWKRLVEILVRRCDEDRSIVLHTMIGLGYHLCTDSEVVNLAIPRDRIRAARRLRRATKKAKCVITENLTYQQRKILEYQMMQIANAKRAMNRCCYASKVVGHPRPVGVS